MAARLRIERENARKLIWGNFIFHGLGQSAIIEGISAVKATAITALIASLVGDSDDEDEAATLMEKCMSFVGGLGEGIVELFPLGDIGTSVAKIWFGDKNAGYWARRRLGSSLQPVAGAFDEVFSIGIDWKKWKKYDKEIASGRDDKGNRLTKAQVEQRIEWSEKASARFASNSAGFISRWAVGAPFVGTVAPVVRKALQERAEQK